MSASDPKLGVPRLEPDEVPFEKVPPDRLIFNEFFEHPLMLHPAENYVDTMFTPKYV
jgi:hypothetical protein